VVVNLVEAVAVMILTFAKEDQGENLVYHPRENGGAKGRKWRTRSSIQFSSMEWLR
jgi:hypothetical protein